MKRWSSPYRRIPCSTSARYALSPQLTSCRRTPETAPVAQLKTRENRRLGSGSLRRVFQPETRSKPSSSLARSFGISAGSSWRSASIVTTTSPRASRKPACSAAAFPKFRRRCTTTTFGDLVVHPREHRHAAVASTRRPRRSPRTRRPAARARLAISAYSVSSVCSSLSRGTTTEITSRRVSALPGRLLQPSSGSATWTGRPRTSAQADERAARECRRDVPARLHEDRERERLLHGDVEQSRARPRRSTGTSRCSRATTGWRRRERGQTSGRPPRAGLRSMPSDRATSAVATVDRLQVHADSPNQVAARRRPIGSPSISTVSRRIVTRRPRGATHRLDDLASRSRGARGREQRR